MFQDITTMLLKPDAFRDTIELFVEQYKDKGITVIAGNVKLSATSFVTLHAFMVKKLEL